MFPNKSPPLLLGDEELSIIVLKELDLVSNWKNTVIDDAVLALGKLQLSSLDYVPQLESAGCKRLGPENLKEIFTDLLADPEIQSELQGKPFQNQVERDCDLLLSSNVPLAICHGDILEDGKFISRLNDRGDQEFLFNTYDSMHIGFPFCDLRNIKHRLDEDQTLKYLRLWSDYGTPEELRKVYDASLRLGRVVSLSKQLEEKKKSDRRTNDSSRLSASEVIQILASDSIDIVRAVVLNEKMDQVLMVNTDDVCDLPCFSYEEDPNRRWDRFCEDFEAYLQVSSGSRPTFRVLFDLINWIESKGEHDEGSSYLYLMVMEYRCSQSELEGKLPSSIQWKDAGFVGELITMGDDLEDKQVTLREVRTIILTSGIRLKELKEPRHQSRWLDRCTEKLQAFAESCGFGSVKRVVEKQIRPEFTTLMAYCDQGNLVVKSPLTGSSEGTLSHTMHKLFGSNVADLNIMCWKESDLSRTTSTDFSAIAMELGRLQVNCSLENLSQLEAAGCKRRGPSEMKEISTAWLNDPNVLHVLQNQVDSLKKIVREVDRDCNLLLSSNIPLSICLGNLEEEKKAFKIHDQQEQGQIVFQRFDKAHIGFPFCDLFNIRYKMDEDEIQTYLQLWSSFGSSSDLRQIFDAAERLGQVVALSIQLEYLQKADRRADRPIAKSCLELFKEIQASFLDIVRAIVLDGEMKHVLMVNTDDEWDLPCFPYHQEPHRRWDRFCADLDDYLLSRSEYRPMFTVLFDLINWVKSKEAHDGATAYLYVVVMNFDCTQSELEEKLPSNIQWKGVDFISQLINGGDAKKDNQGAFQEVRKLLIDSGTRLKELEAPRHQPALVKDCREKLEVVSRNIGYGSVKSVVQKVVLRDVTELRASCEQGTLFARSPVPETYENNSAGFSELYPDKKSLVLHRDESLDILIYKLE